MGLLFIISSLEKKRKRALGYCGNEAPAASKGTSGYHDMCIPRRPVYVYDRELDASPDPAFPALMENVDGRKRRIEVKNFR